MKINNSNKNIGNSLNNIERLLLNFEQLPQIEVLSEILGEIQKLTQDLRKYYQLKSILALINELIILVSAAIEKIIILDLDRTDLILNVTDLISYSCDIEYNNLNDIILVTEDITTYYISLVKDINKDIPLLKRTKYLKFNLINTKETRPDTSRINHTTANVFDNELRNRSNVKINILENQDNIKKNDINYIISTVSTLDELINSDDNFSELIRLTRLELTNINLLLKKIFLTDELKLNFSLENIELDNNLNSLSCKIDGIHSNLNRLDAICFERKITEKLLSKEIYRKLLEFNI